MQEAPSVKLVLLEPQQAVAALSRLSVAEVFLRREPGAGLVPSRSMVVAEVGTVISQRVAVEVPLRPEVVPWGQDGEGELMVSRALPAVLELARSRCVG